MKKLDFERLMEVRQQQREGRSVLAAETVRAILKAVPEEPLADQYSSDVPPGGTTTIRIDQTLYREAKAAAAIEGRTVSSQLEHWVTVGRAALKKNKDQNLA